MNNDLLIEKIISLVDGELNSEESAEIIDAINQNPELQDEFNYHLKMKNVYGKMVEQPPSHLKSRILATSGLGFLFWKTKSFIISSISTGVVVATAIGYYLGLHDTDSFNNSEIIKNKEFAKIAPSISLPDMQEVYVNKTIENFSESYNRNIQEFKQTTMNNTNNNDENDYNILPNEELIASNNIENGDLSSQIDNNLIESSQLFKTTFNDKYKVNSNKKIKVRRIYSDDEDFKSFFQMLNVDVRRSFAGNKLNLDFNNPETNKFNISSVSLFYEYNDNVDVGIEVGSENYAQKFHFVENDKTTIYQQYFNAVYYGISAKYYLPVEVLDRLRTFSKVFVGGNELGPVTRVEFALEYKLDSKLFIYGAYEISNLTYFHGGSTFNSSRNGFNFGLKYDME